MRFPSGPDMEKECGLYNYRLTVAVEIVATGIGVPWSMWIHSSLRRWRKSLTQSLRDHETKGEAKMMLHLEGAPSPERVFHDEQIRTVTYHLGLMKTTGILNAAYAAVMVSYSVMAGYFGWAAQAVCTSRGPWGSLQWPFLRPTPYPTFVKPAVDFLGSYFHCDGVWWFGNDMRIVALACWALVVVLPLVCFRGGGSLAYKSKQAWLPHILMLCSPFAVAALMLVVGDEAMSWWLGGAFGLGGAAVALPCACLLENAMVRLAGSSGFDILRVPGLEGPRYGLKIKSPCKFPPFL